MQTNSHLLRFFKVIIYTFRKACISTWGFLLPFFNQTYRYSLCFIPIKVWGSLAIGKGYFNPTSTKFFTKYLKLLMRQKSDYMYMGKTNLKNKNKKTHTKLLFLPLSSETLHACLDWSPCWFFWCSLQREMHRYHLWWLNDQENIKISIWL